MKTKLLFQTSAALLALALSLVVFAAYQSVSATNNLESSNCTEENDINSSDYTFLQTVNKNIFIPLIK